MESNTYSTGHLDWQSVGQPASGWAGLPDPLGALAAVVDQLAAQDRNSLTNRSEPNESWSCGGYWTAWKATGSESWPRSTPTAPPAPTKASSSAPPPAGSAAASTPAPPPPAAGSGPPGPCSAAP
jgi:hypothetical protein